MLANIVEWIQHNEAQQVACYCKAQRMREEEDFNLLLFVPVAERVEFKHLFL